MDQGHQVNELYIFETVIRMGAASDIGTVTINKVSDACGISAYRCFTMFGTAEKMRKRAADSFEDRFLESVSGILEKGCFDEGSLGMILDVLVEDRDGLLYYCNHSASISAIPVPDITRRAGLENTFRNATGCSEELTSVLWKHVMTYCFEFAKSIVRGYTPDDADILGWHAKLLLDGIRG